MARAWRVSRRGFLIGLGVTAAGVALGVRYGVPEARLAVARVIDGGSAPGSIAAPPNLWFEIAPDNTVSLYLPKVEMGQGVHTALAQIAAEDLEIDWRTLQVRQASTGRGLVDRVGTSASNTVSSLYTPLREAGAILRVMLVDAAARLWGVPAQALEASSGTVYERNDPKRRLSYGEIVAATSAWEVPREAPPLKPISEFRTIGKSMPRVDLESKLTGKAVYGYDARLPGMLYGAVARPRTVEGRLVRAAEGNARSLAGVVAVVVREGFAGVAAESRAQARAALEALELEWDDGPAWNQEDIDGLVTVRTGEGVVIQRQGDALRQLGGDVVAAEYRTPLAAHAQLEPQAALVDVQEDGVRAWVSTQSPFGVRRAVARALGRKEEDVEVTATYLGGGFGHKVGGDIAVEAARLSEAAGRPVHVGWSRGEDFRSGYLRPPTHHVLRARLEGGRVEALVHEQASGDVAFAFLPEIAATVLGADFGAWRGATVHYGTVPHLRASTQRVRLPVKTGWWRGLGLLANTFAVESFIDELAHAAEADPLRFRLEHLAATEEGQRLGGVLVAAAEHAGWYRPLREGHALGIACCRDVNTMVAEVAEVALEDGKIRVHKVTAAIDPGLVVNPDGVRAQTEGAVIMGLGSALLERVQVKDGRIGADNFDRYPLMTLESSPDIEVVITGGGHEPYGVGEPPIGPVAAAVANAVFSLTGRRLRTLPLSLEEDRS